MLLGTLTVPCRQIGSRVSEPTGTRSVHIEPVGEGVQRAGAVTTGNREAQVKPPPEPLPGHLPGGGPEFESPTRLSRALRPLAHDTVVTDFLQPAGSSRHAIALDTKVAGIIAAGHQPPVLVFTRQLSKASM
jgi:hypothetical protein